MKKNILCLCLLNSAFAFAMEFDEENPQAATQEGSPVAERHDGTNENDWDPLASFMPPDSGVPAPIVSAPSLSAPRTSNLSTRDSQESSGLRSCWEFCCVPDEGHEITGVQACCAVSLAFVFVAGLGTLAIMD